jgi:hypothetical protein
MVRTYPGTKIFYSLGQISINIKVLDKSFEPGKDRLMDRLMEVRSSGGVFVELTRFSCWKVVLACWLLANPMVIMN